MIVDFFLYVVYAALLGLTLPLRLLNTVSANSTIQNAIVSAYQAIAPFKVILPLGTVFAVIAAIITVELIIALYKVIMWVLRRIPTQS